MLAVFGKSAGASLHLNEFAENRRELLRELFPHASITGLDAAQIDDRLDRKVAPSVVWFCRKIYARFILILY